MTFTLPSFSYPTSRADFTNVQNMLIAFFTSQGSINAAADAGLALNLKQQNMSDADIVNAILSQDATLQSIANKQRLDAANALAAQAGDVAAVKQKMADAAAKAATASGNTSDSKIITVNGVQETRAQATSFGDNQTVGMCADPDNPRGALIPCTLAQQKLKDRALADFSNGETANAPATSKVVAINGVAVTNTNKPQAPADVIQSADATKNLLQSAINTVTNAGSQVQTIVQNAITGAQKTGADIQGAVTKALSDAGLAASKEAQDLLASLGLAPPASTPKPSAPTPPAKGTDTATRTAPAPQNPVDQITSFFQKLLGGQTTTTPTPAQPDLLTQIETGLGTFISTAETNLNGIISKFSGNQGTSTDPTKSGVPTTSQDNNAPSNVSPPPVTPTLTNTDTNVPNPIAKATFLGALDIASVIATAKKYALPIILITGGVATMGVAIKLSQRPRGIVQNV